MIRFKNRPYNGDTRDPRTWAAIIELNEVLRRKHKDTKLSACFVSPERYWMRDKYGRLYVCWGSPAPSAKTTQVRRVWNYEEYRKNISEQLKLVRAKLYGEDKRYMEPFEDDGAYAD